ncbi:MULTISPECIES: small multi-drug export protein [unclassified Leptotrichia]|jgi:putative small multidrug export related protein|uniref:COG2426 family protein n=1 Tax=unclassified Leptotrichia TaxID=2633022 RepID=UPI001796FE79|nr:MULTISPECIES: small multi-drug export protein [unclassified Leptotrichia]MBB1534587.1 small multi-drug export protein [Leptotrichia sp.]QUB97663.1 small multi-drug export protein [Leptotrichia sp. oral taxon 221]
MKSFNEFIKVSLLGASLLNKMFGIFLISMLPVVELRGAIPVGAAIGLPWYLNMIVSIVGNLLPVPFILLFSVKAFEFMKKHNILVKFIEKIENRAKKRSEGLATGEFIGLMLFVAIPFPGTGAWTGALIAALLQFERKRSFIYITLGVLIAAAIMTAASYGVISLFK